MLIGQNIFAQCSPAVQADEMSANYGLLSVAAVSLLSGVLIGQYLHLPFLFSGREVEKDEWSEDEYSSDEEVFQVDSTSLNDIPGETRMALVVRTDLKMTKGKAAAQCSHATLGCYKLMLSTNPAMLKRWERSGQAKITLQTRSLDEMELLYAQALSLNVNAYIVHDAGRTQIEPGSATVLGLGPAPKPVLDQITGELKLY